MEHSTQALEDPERCSPEAVGTLPVDAEECFGISWWLPAIRFLSVFAFLVASAGGSI